MSSDRIEREIVIDAPQEVVWSVVTEPEQMSRWLTDRAEYEATPGAHGALTWKKHGSYDIRIQQVERPRLFSYRWVWPAGNEPDETNSLLVEFTLTEEDGGTRLRLVESGFDKVRGGDEASRDGHVRGWDKYLGRLLDYVGELTEAAAR
jgi:uncharacterized protein YndB with AHSA1/START domain